MAPTAHSYFSIPPRNFDVAPAHRADLWSEQVASANESDVRPFPTPRDAGQTDFVGSGVSYRHDWGRLTGCCHLFLSWAAIDATSRAFVSIAEGFAGGPEGGKLIGTANVRLFDVAPTMGGIGVRVRVDGDGPIRLFADYLVINA